MFNLSLVIYFLTALAVVSTEEEIKEFHFTKDKNVKNEFFFEYIVDGLTIFNGKTSPLSNKVPGLFLMVGPQAKFYWVKLSNDELYKQEPFDKIVRSVEIDTQHEVLADLKDDFFHYKVYNNGKLTGGTYNPDWDLDNIGFTLADAKKKVFDYTIFSKNNHRQVVGTTSHDKDAHIQRVLVPDRHECYTFQATFTDNELRSTKLIYKKAVQVLRCSPPKGVPPIESPLEIEPALFRNLASSSLDE